MSAAHPTPHSFIVCYIPDSPSLVSPTAHPISHVESALLPPRPSSIHIGLAAADPGIAQSGCALPVESGFAQFREREGGGVDLGMRVEATATDEQEDGMECRDPRPTFSLPTSRVILSTYMTIISPTHTRADDVPLPHPYILPTPGLSSRRIGRWISSRGRYMAGSTTSPGAVRVRTMVLSAKKQRRT
jgi:hypothetical protein